MQTVARGILPLALAWGAATVALYLLVARPFPGAADFYPRWFGIRALVVDGRDPYSVGVTVDIQRGVYGRPAAPNEDQVAFAYPLHLTWPLAVLAPLPYAWAQAAWQALLLVAVAGGTVWLARRETAGQIPLIGLAALIVWAIGWYPVGRGLALGQIALLSGLLVIVGVAALPAASARRSGIALALATIKPQVSLLWAIGVVVWSVRRRSRLPAWLVGALVTVSIPAFALVPAWPAELLTAIAAYGRYTRLAYGTDSALGLLLAPLGEASGIANAVLTACLVLALAAWWIRSIAVPSPHRGLGLATTLATLVLIPAQGTPAQVLLLPVFVRWLCRADWPLAARIVVGGLVLTLPWWLFFATERRLIEHPAQYWVLPAVAVTMSLLPPPSLLRTARRDSRIVTQ